MTKESGAAEKLPEVAESTLADGQVATYLREHPEFFLSHQELLADLTLPHESGQAVSLLERQVKLLRERNSSTREQLGSLLVNASKNDQIFEITRNLILALLRARTTDELTAAVHDTFTEQENIDACELVLDTGFAAGLPGKVKSAGQVAEVFADVFRLNHTHCGKPTEAQLVFLLGGDADAIRSTAICPILTGDRPLGILAIGSKKSNHFNLDLDTLFLDFIGNVVAAVLEGQLTR